MSRTEAGKGSEQMRGSSHLRERGVRHVSILHPDNRRGSQNNLIYSHRLGGQAHRKGMEEEDGSVVLHCARPAS